MPRTKTEFAIFAKFQDASGSTSEGPKHNELWEDMSAKCGRFASTDEAKRFIQKSGDDFDGQRLMIVGIRWEGDVEVERVTKVKF